MKQEGGAVRQQGVSLHLSKADASLDVPPSHGLVGHLVSCPCGPHLKFVRDHVTQPLVVDDADEDVRLELLTAHSAVEPLRAVVVVSAGPQHFTKILQRGALLGESEGRGVVAQAVQGAGFAGHALDQHTDGHAGGKAVRVEQDVGGHAALGERHVLGGPQAAQDALLTVATGKLVTDGGVSWYSYGDADSFKVPCASVVAADLYIVDYTGLLIPRRK